MSDYPERWLPVVGWEGLYEVSNLGRVRSLPRKGGNNRMYGGRILRPGLGSNGYLTVVLCRQGAPDRSYCVHTLVLEAFSGPRPDRMEACHGPMGPLVNAWPSNLSWGTRAENAADRYRDGTDNAGERHNLAKLTESAVRSIRTSTGRTYKQLAAEFGVSYATISDVKRRRTWIHV